MSGKPQGGTNHEGGARNQIRATGSRAWLSAGQRRRRRAISRQRGVANSVSLQGAEGTIGTSPLPDVFGRRARAPPKTISGATDACHAIARAASGGGTPIRHSTNQKPSLSDAVDASLLRRSRHFIFGSSADADDAVGVAGSSADADDAIGVAGSSADADDAMSRAETSAVYGAVGR